MFHVKHFMTHCFKILKKQTRRDTIIKAATPAKTAKRRKNAVYNVYTNKSHIETGRERALRIILILLTGLCIAVALSGGICQERSYWRSAVVLAAFALFLTTADKIPTYKTVSANIWWFVVFAAALAARLIAVQVWAVEPSSDFGDTYRAATALAKADVSQMPQIMKSSFNYYYTVWPAHIVFILIEAAVIKIFGEGYYAIQIIFCIFGALSCLMTAKTADSFYGRRAGVVAGILMALFPLNLFFAGVLSNQHIAAFFFLAAVYILSAKPFKKHLLNISAAALCTGISQLVRPEMHVFVVAVVCYFVYTEMFLARAKSFIRRFLRLGCCCAVFIGIYVVLLFGTNAALMQSGIIEKPITGSNLTYKIATGLNTENMGLWNEEDAPLTEDETALHSLIGERLSHTGDIAILMYKKLMYQFGTYNYIWCVPNGIDDMWYAALTTDIMIILLLLCIVRLAAAVKGRNAREVLLFIILIGYFITFAVIEAQNRYNYAFIPIFIIIASGGFERVLLRRSRRIRFEKTA